MARVKTYRGEPIEAYRHRVLESEHFSPEEAAFYADRCIGGVHIRWLRRARIRFWKGLTPAQRGELLNQVGDWYSHRTDADAELGAKRYSPKLEEDRKEMLEFWEEAMEGARVRLHLR